MDNSSRLMLAVVMVIAYMAMRGQTQNSTQAQNATSAANTTANVYYSYDRGTYCQHHRHTSYDNCDPSVAGSCFFVSTKQSSGQTFSFQLRGVSSGYIAVGLSTDSIQGGNDTTYVCANNNGIVQFLHRSPRKWKSDQNNTLPVNSVKGSVNNQTIQCTFSATVPNATATRSSDTSFFILHLQWDFY
ncbi:unnamed protein product [Coregonus sp. 'balchen']|nr:unnamed protein product [Coregonus sp. 'balchen']